MIDILYSSPLLDKKAGHPQTTKKDICDSKIEFDFSYRCGIRKERLRPCLSQRSDTVCNFSLLEEVIKQGFHKMLKIKLPRDFVTSLRLLRAKIESN